MKRNISLYRNGIKVQMNLFVLGAARLNDILKITYTQFFTPSENRKLRHNLTRCENFQPEISTCWRGEGGGGILARYTKISFQNRPGSSFHPIITNTRAYRNEDIGFLDFDITYLN